MTQDGVGQEGLGQGTRRTLIRRAAGCGETVLGATRSIPSGPSNRRLVMKWLGVVGMAACLAGTAAAGDYHNGSTLQCSDCHVMHYVAAGQTHGYEDGRTFNQPGTGGPFTNLLRDNINDLCLACHDGGTANAPDVFETDDDGLGTDDYRGAGGLTDINSTDVEDGHTLLSPGVAPGGSFTGPLNCAHCHEPHGISTAVSDTASGASGSFRNLRDNPGGGTGKVVTYAINTGANPTVAQGNTYDVWLKVQPDGPGGPNWQYDEDAVEWMEPDDTASAIAAWCGDCHTNFHGAVGDGSTIGGTGTPAEDFVRHPAGGVDIGAHSSSTSLSNLAQYQNGLDKVKVMGDWNNVTTGAPGDPTPTCISCHKAHGTTNKFGLIYRSRDLNANSAPTENGDDSITSNLEHLCGQCHTQAAAFDD